MNIVTVVQLLEIINDGGGVVASSKENIMADTLLLRMAKCAVLIATYWISYIHFPVPQSLVQPLLLGEAETSFVRCVLHANTSTITILTI